MADDLSIKLLNWAVTICLGFGGLASSSAAAAVGNDVDFSRDIRPILSDRCFACHGPDENANESGLRLDLEETAKGPLPSGDGFAIVANDPAASEILRRIDSNDLSLKMPPADSHLKVSTAERALLKKWIESGAEYSEHWAFVAPKKSQPPVVTGQFKLANEIDSFVIARLEEQAFNASPAADRHTLIRRLSLDLTGLPPTSKQVLSFVNDQSNDAYESLVDRLLESPHFGERMALDWLDAARYADTNGFSIDGGRHMWLWRDWVIHAFNSNKPYDEFLIEQVAGDLIPNATAAQLIASGFQRNNMVTHEGGTIPDENLVNYNADRVKTLGEAVLGLTLACAQCHDHKYDPISQKDYYRLFAYFNSLNDHGLDGDNGVNPKPFVKARTVLQTDREQELQETIADLELQLAEPDPNDFRDWQTQQKRQLENRNAGIELHRLDVLGVSTPNSGAGFDVKDQRFVQIHRPGWLAAYDVLSRVPKIDKPIDGIRVVFHPSEKAPGTGWGYGKQKNGDKGKGNFVLTALSVSAGDVASDQVDLFRLQKPVKATANSWQEDYRPEFCLDMRNQNGWSPEAIHDGPVHITLTFESPLPVNSINYLTAQLNFGTGGSQVAANMEFFAFSGVDDGYTLPKAVVAALHTSVDKRSRQQLELLKSFYSNHAVQTERIRIDLENARQRLSVLTQEFSTMVMSVAEKPRETFVLRRGDYSQPTDKVEMGTPEFLPPGHHEQQNRLALARWLTMPNHPLTARVYVNRVWQMLFGTGIVGTPADFGAQGSWPSHPKLLDWLAVDFIESNWDIKRLVKKIVMSATYQQSSIPSNLQLKLDPQNRLLARGPRFRLPAEFVRDSALKVSGLIKTYLGGPSVNPYAPGDLWREISHYGSTPATAQTFVQDHGDKLYRRSLYTYWKRTSPPPNMTAFDAPNRETCVVSRPMTNTPLQALVTLNDVQFVEAARAFAERMIRCGDDDETRIQWAIFEALSRPASQLEKEVLASAVAKNRSRFETDPDAAQSLLAVGESLRDSNIHVAEHAAWTVVASTILNLSEFVSRN